MRNREESKRKRKSKDIFTVDTRRTNIGERRDGYRRERAGILCPHRRPIISILVVCKTQAAQLKLYTCVCVLIMAVYWPFLDFTNIVHYYNARIIFVIWFLWSFIMWLDLECHLFLVLLTQCYTILCPFASKMLLMPLLLLLHFTSHKIATTILLSYHFRLFQCYYNIEYDSSRLYTHVFMCSGYGSG